jgi:hypothetical protein
MDDLVSKKEVLRHLKHWMAKKKVEVLEVWGPDGLGAVDALDYQIKVAVGAGRFPWEEGDTDGHHHSEEGSGGSTGEVVEEEKG